MIGFVCNLSPILLHVNDPFISTRAPCMTLTFTSPMRLYLVAAVRALCTAAAKNFSQIFAIRFFLGIFESAMLPGVVCFLHFNMPKFWFDCLLHSGFLLIYVLQAKRARLPSRPLLRYDRYSYNSKLQKITSGFLAAASIAGAFSGKHHA